MITLNYDTVIEKIVQFLTTMYRADGNTICAKTDFSRPDQEHLKYLPLAKLHGCVDTEVIVAPTWNKTIDRKIIDAWTKGYELLQAANHIRIVGYSLPSSDAYIKYLFRASGVHAKHLKTIDVICLDKCNDVKRRFDEFVGFRDYRFANANVTSYFDWIVKATGSVSNDTLAFDKLESVHNAFMEAHRVMA